MCDVLSGGKGKGRKRRERKGRKRERGSARSELKLEAEWGWGPAVPETCRVMVNAVGSAVFIFTVWTFNIVSRRIFDLGRAKSSCGGNRVP